MTNTPIANRKIKTITDVDGKVREWDYEKVLAQYKGFENKLNINPDDIEVDFSDLHPMPIDL